MERNCGTRSSHQESKRKESLRRGKWESVFSGNTHGQCSEGDSRSFSHEQASGNRGGGQRRRGQSSSPAPNSKAKTDEGRGKPSKESGNKEESSSVKRSKSPCRFRICKNPSCKFWHPPVCQKYKSKKDANMATNAISDMMRQKEGAKGLVAILKESTQMGCVSQDSHPRKSTPRAKRKIGIKTRRQILHRHLAPN